MLSAMGPCSACPDLEELTSVTGSRSPASLRLTITQVVHVQCVPRTASGLEFVPF